MEARPSGPVLVTGASSGIGRAITEVLSEQDRHVFATARSTRDLASLRELPHVTALRLDVTRDDEIQTAVAAIRRFRRGLYGLVNNAGIADIAPMVDTSIEELHRLLDVNLYGMHRMVRACFPLLAKTRGRVVNIGSTNGFLAEAFAGAYCISKFAVEAYTEVLREEFSALGIRVSVVEPGDFRSDIISSFVSRNRTTIARMIAHSPHRRAFRREVAKLTQRAGEFDRSKYPDPRPVAEAVADALFSDRPRPRYLVASPIEVDQVVEQLFRRMDEVSLGHGCVSPGDAPRSKRRTPLTNGFERGTPP